MEKKITEQLNNAKKLFKNGRYSEASQYFSVIFEENPDCAEALWYKIGCLLEIWHNENLLIQPDSEKLCKLYLDKFGDDSSVLSFIADINYFQRKFNEALTYSKKALSIDFNNEWALTICGNSLTQLNFFEEAIKYFDKIIELSPDNSNAYKNRAYVKLFLDKPFDYALDDYMEAQAKDNTNSVAFDAIAEIILVKGDYETALLYSNTAVKYAKEQNYSQAYLTRSIINYLLENYEEATIDFIKGSRVENYLIEYETKINKYELLGDSEHILNKLNFIRKELKILDILKNMANKFEGNYCDFCGGLLVDETDFYVEFNGKYICKHCIDLTKGIIYLNNKDLKYITKKAVEHLSNNDIMKCAFCNRTKKEVNLLLDASNNIYICNGCVGVCEEVLKNNSDFKTEYEKIMNSSFLICHYCKEEFNKSNIVVSEFGGSICPRCLEVCKEILAEENIPLKYNQPEVFLCENKDVKFCEFCGRSQYDVDKLIASNNHSICNGCVGVCEEVLKNNSDFETEYKKAIDELKKKRSSNARNWFNFRKI